MHKTFRTAARHGRRWLPLWALLGACPLTWAAPFQVMSTAYALGTRNTGPGQAPVYASGSSHVQSPGHDLVLDGWAQTDPLWRQVHSAMTLTVTDYDCASAGGGSCGVQGGAVGGSIQDVVHVISPSAGNHAINVYFRPVEYDGQVSFSGIYGFPSAAVFVTNSVLASVPSTVPGGADTGFTDIAPHTFSMDTDYTTPVPVIGRSNGMVVTLGNGGSFNLIVSWGFQLGLNQGGFLNGVTPHAHGSMLADFSHTVNWGGMAFATDAVTGRPVTDLHFDSALGIDWSLPGAPTPVPEPTPAALWLACLGAAAARRIAGERVQRRRAGQPGRPMAPRG